jgi:hypothetical protein
MTTVTYCKNNWEYLTDNVSKKYERTKMWEKKDNRGKIWEI